MNSKKTLKIKQKIDSERIIMDNKSKSYIKNCTIGYFKEKKEIIEQIASVENLKLA